MLVLAAAILGWEAAVRIAGIPHYILPAPSLVLATLRDNFGSLAEHGCFTLKITFGALLLSAVLGGVRWRRCSRCRAGSSWRCSRSRSCCR